MQRIVRGLSATLTHTFYVDGTATNPTPDSATVTITRDDGTIIVNAGSATDAGTGVFSYTLTPAQNMLLDTLTWEWTATIGGQAQTFTDYVEVAGGVLFTIAEARAMRGLENTVTYPASKIATMRTRVEQALEDACGCAFVPRYRRETISGACGPRIPLAMPLVTAIRSVALNGVAVTPGDLALIVGDEAGVAYNPSGWVLGQSNYTIAYEHGYAYPPERMGAAALLLAKTWLISGPIDDRTTSFTTADGTFLISTPGIRGAWFGVPEVDATVQQYSMQAMVA